MDNILTTVGRSGLVDIGDIISTIDGESVKGCDIPKLVSKIVGTPGSRVQLELLRPIEMSGTAPSPVMIGPFDTLQVEIKRLPNPANPEAPAGLGVLFHKVIARDKPIQNSHLTTISQEISRTGAAKGTPIVIQSLNPAGAAYASGKVFRGIEVIRS